MNFGVEITEVPEMDLSQGSTPIATGGSHDFENKAIGSDTDVEFTITNSGSADLTLTTPISISGADADQFSIQSQPTSPVSGSSDTSFTVRFSPTSTGAKTANISIANNDSDENPYSLTLNGTGIVDSPSVSTTSASSITSSSASSGGNVTDNGGASVTARGVCYNTTGTPTTNDTCTSDGSGTGTYTSSLTGLSSSKKYFVRAYATNSAGTGYGTEVNFTTKASTPTVLSYNVTKITQTTAETGGDVTSEGSASVTAKGVCIAATQNPTTNDTCSSNGTGEGGFTNTFTNLTAGKTYYARAYATNSGGTSYGAQRAFTTPATASKKAPVAKAGPDQSVAPGSTVTLNGGSSHDPDGRITGYAWTEEGSSALSINNASSASASFTAPGSEGSYTIQLQVTDNDGLIGVDRCVINVINTKKPPVAVAGPPQTGEAGALVTLHGENSFDHDGSIASYFWEQLTGETVALSSTSVESPTFTPGADGVRTFKLTVTDNDGLTGAATTCVNTSTGKKPPIAVAYAYIPSTGTATVELSAAQAGTQVNLDGSNSVGRGGASIASYAWEQLAGAPVTIADSASAATSFSATEAGAYTFRLTVTDSNGLEGTDITSINVLNNNQAPTADAGDDQNVALNASVTLDGSGSSDPDGSIATYEWEQIKGESVTLANPNTVAPSFTAPGTASGLMFQLTVTDNEGAAAIDTVIVNATGGTPPSASASGSSSGGMITLDGCGSTGTGLSYAWVQTSGPNVTLNNPDTCSPSFTPSSGTSKAGDVSAPNAAAPSSDSDYSFELLITDSDGLMSTSVASVGIVSGSALNHIIYRNQQTGAFAYVKMNANGTLKNTTGNDGLGLITDWDALNTFSFKGAMTNGGGATQLIIANADGSRYGWLKLNSNGTLANRTVNNGLAWIHSAALNMSNWSMIGIQDNASHGEGLNHLIFQNKTSKDLGFMKLNANGTIKNETGNDGFGRINFSINIHFDDTTGWRVVDIQENADATGADRILLANAGTGMSAFLKLNSNGTLANATVNDGYGFLTQQAIGDYHPVALDNLTNAGVVFKNPNGGSRAFVYAKLNANGTMENLTRGGGWDLMQSSFDLSGFDVFGFTTIGGENAMLLRNPTGGRVAWLKLNANGTAKNLTANNGLAWVSPDYSPLGWRAVSMDPTSY